MPKLNIYVDEDLFKRVKKYNLQISPICQQALWAVIEREDAAVCEQCDQPALFYVQNEEGHLYTCKKHLTIYVEAGVSTVRAL
jgi:hypothetical protein